MTARPGIPEDDAGVRSREQGILAERAAALARRGAASVGERTESGVDHLVCACGVERYGLPLGAVAQVVPMRPCTPVPGAVPALVGLVALSGRVVGVLGLARALGRPGAAAGEAGGEPGHLVVLRGARPLALAVDRVLGIARAAGDGGPRALSAEVDTGSAHKSASQPRAGGGTDRDAIGHGSSDPDGLGVEAASGYAPAGANAPDFVAVDLPRLLRRALP